VFETALTRPSPAVQVATRFTVTDGYIAASLVLVAFFLRLLFIGSESFWSDELFTYQWTLHSQEFLWGEGRRIENNPPLYYSLAALWRGLFGSSEAHLRALSALASGLSVGVCYAIGLVLLGRAVGFTSAVVLTLLPFAWHYGQDARPVALLPFTEGLMLLAVALYFTAAEREGRAPSRPQAFLLGFMFVFSSVVAIYSHATAMLFLAALGVAIAVACLSHRWLGTRSIMFWAIAGVVTLVFGAPIIGELLKPSHTGQANWVPGLSPLVLGSFFSQLAAGKAMGLEAEQPKVLQVAVSGTIYLIAAGGALQILMTRRRSAFWVILAIPAAYVMLLTVVSIVQQPILISRYALVLEISLALLLGSAVALTKPITKQLPVALVALCLPAGLAARERSMHLNEDWRSLVKTYEDDEACAGAAVFAPPQFASLGWDFYGSSKRSMPPTQSMILQGASYRSGANNPRIIQLEDFQRAVKDRDAISLVTHRGRSPQLIRAIQLHRRSISTHNFAGRLQLICSGAE
jgi:mannosyltransferase